MVSNVVVCRPTARWRNALPYPEVVELRGA